jgi:EAL domain-containing protein (putative c-di-GMP-specific phosphodiesterase class I)
MPATSYNELRNIASRLGFISAIDRWQIKEAVSLLAQLQARDELIALAIRLDATTFTESDMLDNLRRTVHEAAIDPAYLILEVTGTTAFADVEKADRFVDDLPIDYLRLGADLLRNVVDSELDQEMVRFWIRMARVLKVETIAYGVHTEATRAMLQTLGVNYGVGRRFGRPRLASTLLREPGGGARHSKAA